MGWPTEEVNRPVTLMSGFQGRAFGGVQGAEPLASFPPYWAAAWTPAAQPLTRLATLIEPMPVAKSQPVPVP